MKDAFIKPALTDKEIRKYVEILIEPALADAQAKALCELLFAVSGDEGFDAAKRIGECAYQLTSHFQSSFEAFAGLPQTNFREPDSDVFEVRKEQ